jgi:protein O-GlcNAc transferase
MVLSARYSGLSRETPLMPSNAQHLQQALRHHQAGEFEQAENLYRQILAADPKQVDALHLLGVLAHQVGNNEAAVELISQAVQFNGAQPIFHNNFAAAYRALGKLPEAQASYERAIRLNPRYVDAHSNLATVLHARGLLDEAARACRQALQVDPNFAEAHNNLGNVLRDRGETEQAEQSYRAAIRARPNFALAHNNLGSLALDRGRLDEATACFKTALQFDPHCAEAYGNLGLACLTEGRPAEAVASFEQSYALVPNDAMRLRAAIAQPVIHDSAEVITDSRRATQGRVARLLREPLRIDAPEHAVGITAMNLAYQGFDDRPLLEEIARLFSHAAPALNYVADAASVGKAPMLAASATGTASGARLRIGIISRHLHNHSNSRLNLGIIRELPRDRFHVTVFRFPGREDETTALVKQAADETVTLPVHLGPAQQEIARRCPDVLFYTDIGMEPLTYCLAFARLAPVQCTTWGVPVTSGIRTIDYYLSSVDLEPEGAQAHYTEKLVLLSNLPTFYDRPTLRSTPRTREHFGWSDSTHVYICPQSLFKFHPEFDAAIGEILRTDRDGVLVLLDPPQPHWRELLRRRWQRTIGDVLDRIQFLPPLSNDDFLHLLALADVMLDPFHFGGGNTTYEALAFGTPIVTWPGPFMRGRVTYACYRQMQELACVAASRADYAPLAVRLGQDAACRQEVRDRLRAASGVLYENRSLIAELADFFERVTRL